MSLNEKKRLVREKAEQYNNNGRSLRQHHVLTADEVKQGKDTNWQEIEIIGILYSLNENLFFPKIFDN